jgi:hypothetical protein
VDVSIARQFWAGKYGACMRRTARNYNNGGRREMQEESGVN